MYKKIILISILAGLISGCSGVNVNDEKKSFVTVWNVQESNITGDNLTIYLPTGYEVNEYDANIDWGDGTSTIFKESVFGNIGNIVNKVAFHRYQKAGIYEVSISGKFPHLMLSNVPFYCKDFHCGKANAEKLIEIKQWGDIETNSFVSTFLLASNLKITATDVPNLSNVSDLRYMFGYCDDLDADFSNWDIQNIKNMYSFLTKTRIPQDRYDAMWLNWAELDLKQGVEFGADNKHSEYVSPTIADIKNVFGWKISDGGELQK